MSIKCIVLCKVLESDEKPAPVIILFGTVRLEVQGMKAASKVEVYFVSDHFCLSKIKSINAREQRVYNLLFPSYSFSSED